MYFLAMEIDEAEVRLHHLLLRLPRLALALLHLVDDVAEFLDLQPRLEASERMSLRIRATLSFSFWQKDFQPFDVSRAMRARPVRVELVAAVVREEIGAVDAVALAKPEQLAVVGDEPLVDVVELLDQLRSMRAWFSDSDFTSVTISSVSFFWRRSLRGGQRMRLAEPPTSASVQACGASCSSRRCGRRFRAPPA